MLSLGMAPSPKVPDEKSASRALPTEPSEGERGEGSDASGQHPAGPAELPTPVELLTVTLTELAYARADRNSAQEQASRALAQRDTAQGKLAGIEAKLECTQGELTGIQAKLESTLTLLRETEQRLEAAASKLDWFRRKFFGSSSERIGRADLQKLLVSFAELFGWETVEEEKGDAQPGVGKPDAKTEHRPPRRRRGHGRKKPATKLPRVRNEHGLDKDERRCDFCKEPKQLIGFLESTVLEFLVPLFYVLVSARAKYACKTKGCPGRQEPPQTAPLPPQPIPKGGAGPGMLAHVVTSKYDDHAPLHRQAKILRRNGAPVAESTLGGWVEASADLLAPLAQHMGERVLSSEVLQTDDTILPVLREPYPEGHEKHGQRQSVRKGRLWGYRGDQKNPYTFYDYTPTWSAREGPERVLADFDGQFLQGDAYAAYDAIMESRPGQKAGCMAHARRKVFDALVSDQTRSRVLLTLIQGLYKVEDYAREQGLEPDALKALRQRHSAPLFDIIEKWLDENEAGVPPKSPLGTAVTYLRNQWATLKLYLEDGRLEIDNTAMERDHRGVAVGRKNWLFAGSDEAARRTAIVQTVIVSAKRNGLDVWIYLRHLFAELPRLPAEGDARKDFLDALLPDRCQFLKDQDGQTFLGPDILRAMAQSLEQLAGLDQ